MTKIVGHVLYRTVRVIIPNTKNTKVRMRVGMYRTYTYFKEDFLKASNIFEKKN